MRHLSTKLLLAFAVMLPLFYGCGNDDDDDGPLAPVIASLSPDEGPVGTSVEITGTNFGTSPSVSFGGTSATPTSPSATSLTVTVPTGLAAGDVDVTVTSGGQTSNSLTFEVTEATDGGDDGGDDGEGEEPMIATTGDTLATVADGSLSTLATLLDTLGLTAAISDTAQQVTVFAPNNAAFDSLLADTEGVSTLDELIAQSDSATLAALLKRHVVVGVLTSDQLSDGQQLVTLNQDTLTITTDDEDNFLVNGAQIITPDIATSSGIIHIISSVLTVEDDEGEGGEGDPTLVTVADTVIALETLSTLESALAAASLVEALQGEGPFTVFAPNNDAFATLLDGRTLEELISDLGEGDAEAGTAALADILRAHVVPQRVTAADLAAQDYATLNEGQTITVTQDDEDNFLIDGAGIVSADIEGTNGVVHIINQVINTTPPPEPGATIVSTVTDREDLSSLEAALGTEGVAVDDVTVLSSLEGDGPFTLFAPNNAAFQTLIENTEGVTDLNGLITALGAGTVARVLRAHVVSGRYTFGAVEGVETIIINDNDVYNSLEGPTLTAEIAAGTRTINGANVATADIAVDNGVIHILEEVVNTDAGNTGANGFTVTITNESSVQRYFQQGVFGDAAIASGDSYEFQFYAGSELLSGEPTRLMFATMLVASNDLFFAPNEDGILLYDATTGAALNGDITNLVSLWDAGTEANEEPGGPNQPGQQPAPNTGPGETPQTGTGTVRLHDNVVVYPAVNEMIGVSIDGTQAPLFTVTITNVSGDSNVPTPLSPGVYGVHTDVTPLFTPGASARDGLEALAEDGDPAPAQAVMANNDGFAVPLSPGVYAVHTGASPILAPGGNAADFAGLEALAEDGVPTAFETSDVVKASAVFNTPVGADAPRAIGPGESYEFVIASAEAGDVLSLATMMIQSNDIVYGTSQVGIPLFSNGRPTSGNVTPQIFAYDAGTEVNEYPGAGPNQPIRGEGGTDQGGTIQRVAANGSTAGNNEGGFIYNPVDTRIRVTITPNAPADPE